MPRRTHVILVLFTIATALCAWAGLMGLGRLTNSGFLPDDAPVRDDNRRLSAQYRAGGADLVLLVRADTDVDSAAVAAQGRALGERVARSPGVVTAVSYWSAHDPALRSRDHRAALITVDLVEKESRATRAAQDLVPGFTGRQGPVTVSATGPAWASVQGMQQSRRDLLAGELIAVPLSTLVLLFVFRSLLAALIPLLTALVSVTGTLACLYALTFVMEVSVYAANVACALGFGLAVDYGLFVVTRFREERAAGSGPDEAVTRSTRTAGRTVAVSAGIVALSLCCLFTIPLGFIRSVAVAGILVALLSAAATVCLVPALLSAVGAHLDRWDVFVRLRRAGATGSAGAEEGAGWRRIGRAVCRRPVLWAFAATAALLVLVLPFGHAAFAPSDARVLPPAGEAHRTQEQLRRDFANVPDRTVTIGLPRGTDRAALDTYARAVAALPGAAEVRTADGVYRGSTHLPAPAGAAPVSAAPAGPVLTATAASGRESAEARRFVREIRGLPAPGGGALVSGEPVRVVDTTAVLSRALPPACVLAAAVTMLLLGWFTRSVLIPLKAVAMAVLSLGACVGGMVLIFQDGHLRGLLGGFTVTGTLDGAVALFVLVVAFALSVDYELFLLSRIREEYLATGDNTAAVIKGVQRTGRLVTAAALLVVSAMVALAASGVTLLKVIGVGLAIGVVVDATLVRGILVPALMAWAGRWNWWLPGRLRRRAATGDRHALSTDEGAEHAH
ncbi:MMPL family transporter [Streptomyces syringium]|uniref:MMPL family transporter n=1 Tax=Streptomyces syringium TaxID=76729 RepID=UPI003AACD1AC